MRLFIANTVVIGRDGDGARPIMTPKTTGLAAVVSCALRLGAIAAIGFSWLTPAFVRHVQAATSADVGQWGAAMGRTGLRRFYSTGGDLGELVNRQLSYELANRTNSMYSEVEGRVLQWDTLHTVAPGMQRPLFLRGLVRAAKRSEPVKANGTNDRLDLGMLYAPGRRSYVGFGLGFEHTEADIKFVEGATDGDALGPRIDGGIVLSDTLALGIRLEELHFDGENNVSVPTSGGLIRIDREIEFRRRYLKLELMSRYSRAQFKRIPTGVQLGWMAGIQYLDTRYEPKLNSLGQAVAEPFGDHERLGIARAGLFSAVTLGEKNHWNANLELMADYEIDTNLDYPIDDKTTRYIRAGVAYLVGPGKRIQLDYQDFRSSRGYRERKNLSLIFVFDF